MSILPTQIICKDASAMALAVAEKFRYLASNAVPGPFTVALSGGSTPKLLYETLAGEPFRKGIPWERVEFFFSDERAVPPEHADSNFRMANEALLSKVPSKTHRMEAESGQAEAYEQILRTRVPARRSGIPGFALILLGLGPDGHTASLFPGTEALRERERLVVMNEVPQLKTRRMTFTYPLLNAAKRVWILASGAAKAEVVRACFASAADDNAEAKFPILGVRPDPGELLWWLDEAAKGRSANRDK